jgi:hypothetical protein
MVYLSRIRTPLSRSKSIMLQVFRRRGAALRIQDNIFDIGFKMVLKVSD